MPLVAVGERLGLHWASFLLGIIETGSVLIPFAFFPLRLGYSTTHHCLAFKGTNLSGTKAGSYF